MTFCKTTGSVCTILPGRGNKHKYLHWSTIFDHTAEISWKTFEKAWQEGRDPILREAPGLVVLHAPAQYPSALVDSVIAATTFELVAATMKLGTCWAGYFMGAAKYWEPLRRSLNLPEGHILTAALMLGHPKYIYSGLPQRNKPVIT